MKNILSNGFSRAAAVAVVGVGMSAASFSPAAGYDDCRYIDGRRYCPPRSDIGEQALGFLAEQALRQAVRPQRPQPRGERCYEVPAFNRDGTRRLGTALICD